MKSKFEMRDVHNTPARKKRIKSLGTQIDLFTGKCGYDLYLEHLAKKKRLE